MEGTRFDTLVSSWQRTSRRGVLTGLAGAALVALPFALGGDDAVARRKKHKKHHGGGTKKLREICTPGKDTCSKGLKCDSPTTRHTCSSSIPDHGDWCCVPPGGSCTECDCCGDNYCEFDDNNQPHCVPNPEN